MTYYGVMRLSFEYDPRKATSNQHKHGVSSAEAMTVFGDPLAQTFPDDLHSEEEDRWITIGLSSQQRLLFVSHLETDNRIRLILSYPAQARQAEGAEREAYEELNLGS